MSFGILAVEIGFTGLGVDIAAGAMLGGTMTIGANLITGNDPFANIGKGILLGGVTAGLTPGVAEAFQVSQATAAGITAAGLTTAATGDLSKGLVVGLGAYGLAGLSANPGAPVTPGADPSAALGTVSGGGLDPGSIYTATPTASGGDYGGYGVSLNPVSSVGDYGGYGVSLNPVSSASFDPALGPDYIGSPSTQQVDINAPAPKAPSLGEKLSAKYDAVAKDPKAFLKANSSNLMYAAAPLLAGATLPKTKMPQMTSQPGMIRPYSFDPYSGEYTAGKPYQAAEGGLMGMNDGGYSPGQLNFAQRSDPVVRMASGGIASFAVGGDILGAAAATTPAYTNYTTQQITDYLQKNPTADITAAIKENNADPAAVNRAIAGLAINKIGADFIDPTQTAKGTGTGQYADIFNKYGIDANELFAAEKAINPNYTFAGTENATGMTRAFKTANDFKGFDPVGDTQAAKDIEWVNKMDATGASVTDIARFTGLSIGEVQAREAAARASITHVCPSGSHYDPVTKSCVPNINATQNTTTTVDKPTDINVAPATALPVGVSGAGVTTINPNGTITTTPNIPGRPAGGFTGMTQVKDAYTKGGGSLGYVPYAPKTIEEFNNKYTSRLTGGSKQAYDYLTGKTAYKPTPYTATGELQKPYDEAAIGIPADLPSRVAQKQYLFDAKTRKYTINPDYAIPTRDSKGVVSRSLTNKDVTDYVATKPSEEDLIKWATTNNLSDAQIAAATGMSITQVYKLLKREKPAAATATAAETKAAEDEAAIRGISIGANGGLMSLARGGSAHSPFFSRSTGKFSFAGAKVYADGGATEQYDLGGYSDGGRLLRGPGNGVSDSIPATIGNKRPARLADGEFVVPARIVSELGNGSTEAGARQLYAMMERVQAARKGSIGKGKVANDSHADKYLPA